ncbi:MAG TPA: hypothetical protein DDW85_08440 [Porphyromonadaceae bacterium]|nr:hypothetical protein [Porphyromonadaceae bacterium]
MSHLKTYLNFLSRNKLYTFVSVVGFSVSLMFVIILGLYVKQELSTDDFQENKDRIFLLTHDNEVGFGNPVAPFVQDNCPEVETFVRILSQDVAIGQKGGEKTKARALFADSTFFRTFSYRLIEGNPSQVLEGRKNVVVSRSFAAKTFGGENPVGKSLFIENTEHTITGIMENMPQNSIISPADFVVNYHSITTIFGGNWVLDTSSNFGFTLFFMAKEGADLPAKAPILLGLFKKEFWYFKDGRSNNVEFTPLKKAYFQLDKSGYGDLNHNSRTTITVYLTIAILILVIALLNYINLTVAQAGFRGRESAIKKLLGSSKTQLVSQLLSESLLMTACTFLAGLLLAFLAEPFFNKALGTTLNLALQFTPAIIAACIVSIAFISLLAGIIPAAVISNFDPIEVVKGTFSRKVKSTYSKVLIIFQYTVAIALLVCTIFIQQQSDFLIRYDTGYNREGILEIDNTGLGITQLDGFRAKLGEIPGVELVSFSCGTPVNGGNNISYSQDEEQFSFQEFYVDSAFFKIYGITVRPTGVLPSKDTYWLNETGYKAVHPDTAAQLFRIFGGEETAQIAGIFSDFKIRTLYQDYNQLRMRWRKDDERPWDIIVKMTPGSDYYQTADRIKKEYTKYTGGEVFEASFVDEIIQKNYESVRKTSSIMSAFTLLTIVIMVMGVFAMSLYLIRQKQKEIALRKINGATEKEILLLLNKDSLKRVLIAFAVASPIAWYAMSRWFENFPYKIPLSWWVFAVSAVAVLLLTLISVSYMTWKAARANPVESLKGE